MIAPIDRVPFSLGVLKLLTTHCVCVCARIRVCVCVDLEKKASILFIDQVVKSKLAGVTT